MSASAEDGWIHLRRQHSGDLRSCLTSTSRVGADSPALPEYSPEQEDPRRLLVLMQGIGPGTAAIPGFPVASAPHRRGIRLQQHPLVGVRPELPSEDAPSASLPPLARTFQKPLARVQPLPDWCLQLQLGNLQCRNQRSREWIVLSRGHGVFQPSNFLCSLRADHIGRTGSLHGTWDGTLWLILLGDFLRTILPGCVLCCSGPLHGSWTRASNHLQPALWNLDCTPSPARHDPRLTREQKNAKQTLSSRNNAMKSLSLLIVWIVFNWFFFVIFNCLVFFYASQGPKPSGGPKGGGPKGGGPEGWGPEGWGAQNFALFFLSLPPEISFFLLSLGVFSWNFGGV